MAIATDAQQKNRRAVIPDWSISGNDEGLIPAFGLISPSTPADYLQPLFVRDWRIGSADPELIDDEGELRSSVVSRSRLAQLPHLRRHHEVGGVGCCRRPSGC